MLPGIVSGSLLVFSSAFGEFTLANLLVGSAWPTFPFFTLNVGRANGHQAAALAIISFVITWLISLIILWVANRRPSQGQAAVNVTH
jgi:putative spermidine/putrescine transport system permease protein